MIDKLQANSVPQYIKNVHSALIQVKTRTTVPLSVSCFGAPSAYDLHCQAYNMSRAAVLGHDSQLVYDQRRSWREQADQVVEVQEQKAVSTWHDALRLKQQHQASLRSVAL